MMEEVMQEGNISASEALKRLKEGNQRYLNAETNAGDISLKLRQMTSREGQRPYAVIVTCSDSRVIPESIFTAGIGDLFVIRVAGNVMDRHQLGSVEYAVNHLGSRLVVVLGHEYCGAVNAAIHHEPEGYIKFITDEIRQAIGDEKDEFRACCLNVARSVAAIRDSLGTGDAEENDGLQVCGAVYRLDSGLVEFLE